MEEEFNIANRPGLLSQGQNMLAIQQLRSVVDAPRTLVLPTMLIEPNRHVTNAQYQILDDLAGPALSLVGSETAVRALVPSDGSLGNGWRGGDEPFEDSTWFSGSGGIGYETNQVGATIAAPIAYWAFDEVLAGGTITPDALERYDGTVSGATLTSGGQGMFGEALLFDGDDDYVLPGVLPELVNPSEFSISLWFRRMVDHSGEGAETNHGVNNVLIAQSSNLANDNLEIGTEGNALEIYIDTDELGGPIAPLNQPASIQNETWHHFVLSYDSHDPSEVKLYMDGTLVSEHDEYGGLLVSSDISPFAIGLSRPGSSAWGAFEGMIDDVAVWDAALDSQHIAALFAGTSPLEVSGYADLISLDLQNAMQHENTTAYVRIPFTVSDPGSFDVMKLHMQYDDAFVAYINGMEVARSGMTGVPQWNSAADNDRMDGAAVKADQFIVSNQSGLLVQGQNILAIQMMNFHEDAVRTLVLPQLEAVQGALEPGRPPVYHQIMTAAQRREFEEITLNSGGEFRTDAQMNATFISITDTGMDVRYNAGIRLRGNYSRSQRPPNNRINIPSDRPWQGLTALTFNVQYVVDQIAGYNLFGLSGLATPEAQSAVMYSNGENLRGSSVDGIYAQIETLDTEFARNHFAPDDAGNLYKGRRGPESPPGGQGAGLQYWGSNPAPYVSYQKQTNTSAQDWSDVIDLTERLHGSPDETFLQDVAEVVNIEQWLRFFATNEVLNNHEGGLIGGDESGGDEYAMYRGAIDTRFQMVSIDLDEVFDNTAAPLLQFMGVSALNRLVNHVDVFFEYGAQLWEIANVALAPDAVQSTLLEVLGLERANEINRIVNFLDGRREFVNKYLLAPVSFSLPSGFIEAGSPVTLSSSAGTIYYTTDGSDPRLAGGGINSQAIQYTGQPIIIDEPTKMIARVFNSSSSARGLPVQWSGKTVVDYVAAPDLVISEVNYNPHNVQFGETVTSNEQFEFIEITNAGMNSVDLDGIQFVQVNVDGDQQGMEFTFASQWLHPGEQIVVVKDRVAFQSRYGTQVRIAEGDDGLGGTNGEYRGQLSNRGEKLTLVGPSGITLYALDYNDSGKWPERADGGGSTLELIDLSYDPDRADSWHSSVERGGSPGLAGVGNVASVVINEVLSHAPGAAVDWIEFYNPTATPIEMGGMWLSDNLNDLEKYIVPANTVVPVGGYLVLDENDFGFGISGKTADEVVLYDPGAAGDLEWFIDHVSVGPALAGESFGRLPEETDVLFPLIATTAGTENAAPRIGPVIISEIMYHATNPLFEFVEIYNPTPQLVDLSGWSVDGIDYQFSAGTTIHPGHCLVILPFHPDVTAIADDFNTEYKSDVGANLAGFVGPYLGQLDNGGETLTLRRAVGNVSEDPWEISLVIEDQVRFDNVDPWPSNTAGTVASLQRMYVDLWGNEPSTWTIGVPTPGRYGLQKMMVAPVDSEVIGEVGLVTNLTHEVQTVSLSKEYMHPVVFVQPASTNGTDPVVVRVSDVQTDQFNVFLSEPSNLNGLHNTGEEISFVVIEAGSHWLLDGTHLQVGTVDTNATVGKNIASPTWETVQFHDYFAEQPIIISQTQTAFGQAFLSTRQRGLAHQLHNFQVALEPEEQFGPDHGVETVGYLAIDSGYGVWNDMPFVATRVPYFQSASRTVAFRNVDFKGTPKFVASMSSYAGNDNAHLRIQSINENTITLKVEEDTTLDEEIAHMVEDVDYLAIGGSESLTALSTVILDGLTETFYLEAAVEGVVNDLNVNLEMVHTHFQDLDIFLEAPDGTIVELLTDIGNSSNIFIGTTLDDEAEIEIASTVSESYTGNFQPEGLLRDFAGKGVTGRWALHITDDHVNDYVGALLNWSLDVELATDPPGNLNHDHYVDSMDIDMLFANLGSSDLTFDVNGDGYVDRQDVTHLLNNIMGKRIGDVDLDNDVDIFDFGFLVDNFDPLGQNALPGWLQGNFDGDDDVDIGDFNQLVRNFSPLGYELTTATSVRMFGQVGVDDAAGIDSTDSDTSYVNNRRALHNDESQGVRHSTDDRYLVVDQYFRRARAKNIKLSENESSFTDHPQL